MGDQKALEEKSGFDISEWEEVPFYEIAQMRKHSDVNVLESIENATNSKQAKLAQNSEESQNEGQQAAKNSDTLLSAQVARSLQNQYFIFDYGKKYQKYKKYTKFEQFFRDNYEKSLFFDPEKEIFITNDGLELAANCANQIGTSLLYDSKSKECMGFSNISYNIEVSTMNKALEQAIQEEEEENMNNNQDAAQNDINANQDQDNEQNGAANSNNANNKKKQNTLESIYDWIEKKDKLKQKRIKKQIKSKETQQLQSQGQLQLQQQQQQSSQSQQQQLLILDQSANFASKKSRNPPMNKFIRKMKK